MKHFSMKFCLKFKSFHSRKSIWIGRLPNIVLTSVCWARVTHICVENITIIGSDNGLSPGRRQAIIWTNAGILLIRPLGTNFREILIRNQIFSLKKMHLNMSSEKYRSFCLGLSVLIPPRSLAASLPPLLAGYEQHPRLLLFPLNVRF